MYHIRLINGIARMNFPLNPPFITTTQQSLKPPDSLKLSKAIVSLVPSRLKPEIEVFKLHTLSVQTSKSQDLHIGCFGSCNRLQQERGIAQHSLHLKTSPALAEYYLLGYASFHKLANDLMQLQRSKMEENFLLKTDSYKITHHLQYPEGDHHCNSL